MIEVPEEFAKQRDELAKECSNWGSAYQAAIYGFDACFFIMVKEIEELNDDIMLQRNNALDELERILTDAEYEKFVVTKLNKKRRENR